MSYVSEDSMNYMDPRMGDRVKVYCDYIFKRGKGNESYIKLATRNPNSKKGGYSQNLCISKRAFLKLITDMIDKGYLTEADIRNYKQVKNLSK